MINVIKLPPIDTPPIPRIPRIPGPSPLPTILWIPLVVHAAIPVLGVLALGGVLATTIFGCNAKRKAV